MVVVQVEQGALRGELCHNNDVAYLAFKGIPYAKPPLGSLRFKVSFVTRKFNVQR